MKPNDEFLKRVGMEFKIARIRKGMTPIEVSKLTGLSSQSISAIERGKSDSRILSYKRIADVLEADMKNFF